MVKSGRMGSNGLSEKGKKVVRGFGLSIGGLALAAVIVVSILAGVGVLSIGTTTPVVVVPTEYEIVLHDALDSTNDDEIDDAATITWYRAKVSAFEDEDDWADIAYTDFSSDGTGDDKNPDDDYTYIASITGSDLVTQWVCTDIRVFEGYLPVLSLGTNDLYVHNETGDLALSAYSPVGGTTFNQTDYRDWTVVVNCLDISEAAAAEVTGLEGYGYYYCPSTGTWMTPVIAVTYNTTATNAFGEIQDTLEVSEAAAASVLYFEIQTDISGSTEFDLRLGSGIGTTFEVTQIAVGWGYSGSFTSKDTQN